MAEEKQKSSGRKRRKNRKRKIIAVAAICVIVGTGAAAGFYFWKRMPSGMDKMAQREKTSMQTAQASLGSISNTIVGTGNLELDDAFAVTVPSGVSIEEVMVESGDHVIKGDVLASIDKNSVLEAVAALQEEIEELDAQILEEQEEDGEETLYSSVNGRVKIIYAREDDEITDVITDYGALMVLSMDGKMQTELSVKGSVSAGETVDVTLSSGTVVDGTVETVSGNKCTVTVTDNGTCNGDTVTVKNEAGKELGQGELSIHEPLAITAVSGTITEICVSENQAITDETALVTVEEPEGSTKYRSLLAERKTKADTMTQLMSLISNNKIKAECSGIIQDVNVAANSETGSSSNSGGNSSESIAAASLMSFEDEPEEIEEPTVTEAPVQTILSLTVTASGQNCSSAIVIPAPVTGETPVTAASSADGTYTGAITWNPSVQTFEEATDYQALVLLSAADGYVFQADSIAAISNNGTLSGVHVSEDGKTLEFQIAFPTTQQSVTADVEEDSDPSEEQPNTDGNNEEHQNNGNESRQPEVNENNNSDSNIVSDGETGTDNDNSARTDSSGRVTPAASQANTASGNGNNNAGSSQNGNTLNIQGNSGSGTDGGASLSGTSSDSSDSQSSTAEKTSSASGSASSDSYNSSVTAFTMSSDENMILTVNVDELDINSVEIGQEAEITFDAIEGESFTGTVTTISDSASVNGGVAKYEVLITIPKDDRMRQGMNASATITVDKRENVVTIPMNALQEQGDRVFVYTAQDEDGNLTGEQEVTTGLSDGSSVEITEGLSEGDTVYYQKTGNSSQSTGSGFGGENMGIMGGMNFGGMSGGSSERGNRGGSSTGNTGGQMPPGM